MSNFYLLSSENFRCSLLLLSYPSVPILNRWHVFRMRPFSKCSCSPLAAIILTVSTYILPSIAVSSGTTLFNIPSGSDDGSCDGQNINGIISEAANMANAAITAINNYQSASLLSAPSQAVLNTYETAFAMFGAEGTKVPIVNRVSLSSSGSAILENVKSECRQMVLEVIIEIDFLKQQIIRTC